MRKLAVLALILPLALGCGSDNGGNGGNGGVTEPPDLGDFPLGTFVKTLEESDVSDLVPEEEVSRYPGTYRMTFRSDGTWALNFRGVTSVLGTLTVSGDQVTLTETSGNTYCRDRGALSGTYTWSFDGSALTFSVVSDDCIERRVSSTTKPYVME
jgi:hypothetical protein